jgi:hypothetical protein
VEVLAELQDMALDAGARYPELSFPGAELDPGGGRGGGPGDRVLAARPDGLLSAVIGLEREVRQKSAGLRTHSLVGVGAALFMLVSKYSFSDVLRTGQAVLDPSRMAATAGGFVVDELVTGSTGADDWREPGAANGQRTVEVMLHVHGSGSVNDLATRLSELPGVLAASAEDANATTGLALIVAGALCGVAGGRTGPWQGGGR